MSARAEGKWHDPAIEGRIRLLDETSADVLALERYLARSGIRVRAVVAIGQGEEIAWEEHMELRRWRVTYVSALRHCALIEAPGDARLRARRFMPELLRLVAAAAAPVGEGDES